MKAITPDQLFLILPYKVSQLSLLLIKHYKMTAIEAIKAIYSSSTYRALEKEETKLWHLGPVALFQYFQEHK